MSKERDKYAAGDKLFRLNDLDDYEVADSDTDVRGWEVFSSDNKKVGKVDELIVDTEAMKVRYLDVFVNEGISGIDKDRHLLIPIGAASLDEKKDIVYIKTIETVTLLKMPQYEGGTITRDYERSVRSTLRPEEKVTDEQSSKFYETDLYDDSRFYGSRKKRLLRISELDAYEVLGTNPDVRGWDVIASDGEKIGKVNELIVDSSQKKIRYLDINDTIDNRHILVPVGAASIGKQDDNVYLNIDRSAVKGFPLYKGGAITKEYEYSLRQNLRSSNEPDADDDENFYSNSNYDDMKFYKSRK